MLYRSLVPVDPYHLPCVVVDTTQAASCRAGKIKGLELALAQPKAACGNAITAPVPNDISLVVDGRRLGETVWTERPRIVDWGKPMATQQEPMGMTIGIVISPVICPLSLMSRAMVPTEPG
jgi:hypothetical protein